MINNSLYKCTSDLFMKLSITIEDIPNRMFQMLFCLRDFFFFEFYCIYLFFIQQVLISYLFYSY